MKCELEHSRSSYCYVYSCLCLFLQYDEEGEEADDEVSVCGRERDVRYQMCTAVLNMLGNVCVCVCLLVRRERRRQTRKMIQTMTRRYTHLF